MPFIRLNAFEKAAPSSVKRLEWLNKRRLTAASAVCVSRFQLIFLHGKTLFSCVFFCHFFLVSLLSQSIRSRWQQPWRRFFFFHRFVLANVCGDIFARRIRNFFAIREKWQKFRVSPPHIQSIFRVGFDIWHSFRVAPLSRRRRRTVCVYMWYLTTFDAFHLYEMNKKNIYLIL